MLGVIHDENGHLNNLRLLSLESNKLTGPLLPILSSFNMLSLEYIYLSNNTFNGTLPREIGNMTALKELYLINNELSGKILALVLIQVHIE